MEKLTAQEQKDRVINLIRFNNDLSIIKIEEFLEYLEDEGYLNKEGKDLRHFLWTELIQQKEVTSN